MSSTEILLTGTALILAIIVIAAMILDWRDAKKNGRNPWR